MARLAGVDATALRLLFYVRYMLNANLVLFVLSIYCVLSIYNITDIVLWNF